MRVSLSPAGKFIGTRPKSAQRDLGGDFSALGRFAFNLETKSHSPIIRSPLIFRLMLGTDGYIPILPFRARSKYFIPLGSRKAAARSSSPKISIISSTIFDWASSWSAIKNKAQSCVMSLRRSIIRCRCVRSRRKVCMPLISRADIWYFIDTGGNLCKNGKYLLV